MTPDLINGLFEAGGAIAVGLSVARLIRDRHYAGIHPTTMVFFNGWGLWNLWFYPGLNQPYSFAGSILLAAANTIQLTQLWRFRNASGSNHAAH